MKVVWLNESKPSALRRKVVHAQSGMLKTARIVTRFLLKRDGESSGVTTLCVVTQWMSLTISPFTSAAA